MELCIKSWDTANIFLTVKFTLMITIYTKIVYATVIIYLNNIAVS